MSATDLTAQVKVEAQRLGFALAGICPAVEPTGSTRLREWLERGYAGEMTYLAKHEAAHRHPSNVLDGVRSVVMLTMNYRTVEPRELQSGAGRVSRYAWGDDYHDLIRDRLNQLAAFVVANCAGHRAHGVVDTAPLLEREFAQLAGLGWIGKNTLLLNKQIGSWFFLAALLTTAELTYDTAHETDHCGTCTACLDACPTGAFVQPYVLDARRCISYLTIEHRSAIPHALRTEIGDWLFGCDVCQEVCPWNHRAPLAEEPSFQPRSGMSCVELATLFELDDTVFRQRFRASPLWRAKRRGLLRNAAIILGNQRCKESVASLNRGLCDKEPLVRGACAWALGQIADPSTVTLLENQLNVEEDPEVCEEIHAALQKLTTISAIVR
jgi:epoxyqueuosine reductase